MRFEDYVAERCAIAAREAKAEGIEVGERRRQALVSGLHKALVSSGRSEDFGPALDDEALFESLLREFDISDSPDSEGKA